MDPELVKILGSLVQPGLAGALLVMIWVVGNRLVSSLDRVGTRLDTLGTKVDEHRSADVESHGELAERMAVIEGVIVGRDTPVNGTPTGVYTFGRHKRNGQ